MRTGDVVGGRFAIDRLAGAGGMGQVFRARDQSSGEPVAVKVLLEHAGSHAARFQHETQALAALSHPEIVRYVAHGVTASGQPYLAMEWLDGEDLASRLARGALTIDESITLASRVATALGAAHAQGIVHRDLKPSNIFLVDRRVDHVKVLDFGIARLGGISRVTRTGTMVGTPGYMAPEQAQNERTVDPRADVFSLGCVLFECLTGSPAFAGEHLMALLAKVLFAEPPRLRDLRPEAPAALERLLLQMLTKEPEERPRDGTAVVEALAALDAQPSAGDAARSPIALTRGERRTLSVVVLEWEPAAGISATGMGADETLEAAEAETAEALRRGAEAYGGRLERLRDGSVIVSIGGAGLATDQAAQAARCALELRAHSGGRRVALATGRGDTTGRMAAAAAIDRAVKLLLARASDRNGDAADSPVPGRSPDGNLRPVAIDEMTARLLDGRFDVREGEAGPTLHGERAIAEGARLLLGKPTACVGRDRELTTLAQMFAECLEEPLAQAALVTGPAGMGKSRLLHEILARLRQRVEPFAVWFGRGDALRAGSALGLLGQAVRGACGIRGDDSLPERREKLSARVAQRIDVGARKRMAELLGEITGAPFPDDSSELLRAARSNAQIMTDEMRRAWLDFLRAECAAQPVLLVLEDLHWGDLPTVHFVDAALRDLADRPWMVLALARPEVHDLFPKVWAGRHVQEIQLKPLSKKASERLVRQVLGDAITSDTIDRLIVQADGNAFYLEELIRATEERREEGLPETVVAMVQSRLAALDDEDRRTLRAAAVFGETFWPGGVAALLDSADRAAHVQSRLLGLVERELLVRRSESRFAGEVELAFRHVLLREGAYTMLIDGDRTLGHGLAGEWLERVGEKDPKLLGEHFDRGGQGARAAAYFLRAAEQALERGDFEAAIKLSGRGMALGPEPELTAGLRAVEGEAKVSSGDLRGALRAAGEALDLARPGSRTEARALYSTICGAVFLRSSDMTLEPIERLLHTEPEPDAIPLVAAVFFSVVFSYLFEARRDRAELYLRRLEQVAAGVVDPDPITVAWVELARSMWELHAERSPWGFLEHVRRAESQYELSGLGAVCPFASMGIATAYALLGLFDRAEEKFSRTVATVPAAGPDRVTVGICRSFMLLDQRRLDEASAVAAWVVQEVKGQDWMLLDLTARLYMVEAHLYRGAIEAAESEALALRGAAITQPYVGMWYQAVLACIHLAQGRAEEARAIAERALSQTRACGMNYYNRHAMLLLVHAEALQALGDRAAACQAIHEAQEDLLRRAAKVPDPEIRRSFLDNIPDHRRTLELARRWLGEELGDPPST